MGLALWLAISAVMFVVTFASNPALAWDRLGNTYFPIKSLADVARFPVDKAYGRERDIWVNTKAFVERNNCRTEGVLPGEGGTLQTGDLRLTLFDVRVVGDKCPIKYRMSMKGDQRADGFDATFEFEHEMLTPEAKDYMDVHQASFKGAFKARQIKSGNESGIEYSFISEGTASSKSSGVFKNQNTLSGKTSMIDGSIVALFNETLSYQFEKRNVVLKSKTKFSGFTPASRYESKFEINGDEVTEGEYRLVRREAKFPRFDFADKMLAGGASPVETPMLCRVQIYRDTDYKQRDVEYWLGRGGFDAGDKNEKVVNQFFSCGANVKNTFQVGTDKFKVEIATTPTQTKLQTEICDANGYCNDRESTHRAGSGGAEVYEFKGYTVAQTCAVVPTCPYRRRDGY